MKRDLRMRFLKALVNVPVRLLDRFLPPTSEPVFPQTSMLQRVCDKMDHVYLLEVYQGVFAEAHGGPDGNFERLLRVCRKVACRLSEDDRYYRKWLGLAFILFRDELERFVAETSPEEIRRLCSCQWEIGPDMLSDELILACKREFAYEVLTYYLSVLPEKTLPCAASQEAKIVGG